MTKNKNGRKLKNDIIFISALLSVIAVLGACLFLFAEEGDTVTVKVSGEIYGQYPLDENRTVEIRSGDNVNVFVIRDGRVYMESASCPDGICTDHRPIHLGGQSIICKPNAVVITVTAQDDDAPDTVA